MPIGIFCTYNGVSIQMNRTVSFSQVPQFDTKANKDYRGTKINMTIQGIFNAALSPAVGNSSPAVTMATVRKLLAQPRATFTYSVAGDVLISSPQNNQPEDPMGGPFTRNIGILQMTPTTFVVEFQLETTIYENCPQNNIPYVSQRWRETHDIDYKGYTKRTIDGEVIFRADLVDTMTFDQTKLNADEYRGLIAPPGLSLLGYFQRESMSFTKTEDGLGLQFKIVDQEKYINPPDPADGQSPPQGLVDIKGDFTVSTTNGVLYKTHCVIQVTGTPTTSKSKLMAAAVNVLLQRFNVASLVQLSTGRPAGGYVKDSLDDCYVEIVFDFMQNAKAVSMMGFQIDNINAPGRNDYIAGVRNSISPDVGIRGDIGLHMFTFNAYLRMCGNAPTPGTENIQVGN